MREINPTQSPVPSNNINDLLFNAGLLDTWATSIEREYIDRFGGSHLTSAGMEWVFNHLIEKFNTDIDAAIRAAGYVLVDSFQSGAELPNNEITLRNQLLRDDRNGRYFRWGGNLPKRVAPGSTPESTGGIDIDAWIAVSLDSLSQTTRELVSRAMSEIGLKLADGSFEEGALIELASDVVWQISTGRCYLWAGELPKKINAGDKPDGDNWLLAPVFQLVPSTRKINGKPLTQDLTIDPAGSFPIGMPFLWTRSVPPNELLPEYWGHMQFLKFNDGRFSATEFPILAKIIPSLQLTEARGEHIRIWSDNRPGVDVGRELMSAQGDAIRNITGGNIRTVISSNAATSPTGAFNAISRIGTAGGSGVDLMNIDFSADRVVPTASENRGRNIAFNLLVRAK